MLEAAAQIRTHMATVQFILPLAETLQPTDVQEVLETAPIPVQLVQRQTYEAMQAADVLLVASGTATLEAALIGTPMVIVYKAHLLTYLLARLVMRVSRIGLPNIIAGRAIVPELWQYEVTAEHIAAQALALPPPAARDGDAHGVSGVAQPARHTWGAGACACGILRFLGSFVSEPQAVEGIQ
jgi:lipid-A-disaccharide synthase